MKFLAFALVLSSLSAFASEMLSIPQQKSIVEVFAKEERRELWMRGHQDVMSEVSLLDKAALDVLVVQGRNTYDQLNKDDVKSFYRCIHSPKSCSLFIIDISSEYMSGYGEDRVWVLLNPKNGAVKLYVKQSVYSE
jgi:hypothetical protein